MAVASLVWFSCRSSHKLQVAMLDDNQNRFIDYGAPILKELVRQQISRFSGFNLNWMSFPESLEDASKQTHPSSAIRGYGQRD
jgi:hypothetical protein